MDLKYNVNKRCIILTIICVLAVFILWQFKYKENYNYMNSNASWHVLLTVQAYDETPVSVHKFLPLVSLGDEWDKEIQWAEMVSDEYGNYYYASFSAAGFVLPYLFFKIFNLPVSEESLYLFNTVLCCMALLLTIKLFCDLFKNRIQKEVIILITTLLFASQTEIMHGLGQVYWPQSILQVLLPLQFLCFYHFEEDKKWKIGFYILALIMPYIEWTGFIANVGFAIVLFFKNGIKIQKKNFMWAFWTGVCTAAALLFLIGHYLLVVDWENFYWALHDRVAMRTTYAYVTTFELLWGYWKSFKGLWILLPVLGLSSIILNKGLKWLKGVVPMLSMVFVMLFPLVENILMKEHAVSYTYDRMKMVYPLLLAVFVILASIPKEKEWFVKGTVLAALVCAVMGINSYIHNTEYLWEAEYREDNEILGEYCRENYHEDAVYGLKNAAVRGYVNVLFDRGVYENISEEMLLEKAKERGAKYAVMLIAASEPDPANVWNMYAFSGVKVYDLADGTVNTIYVSDGAIVEEGNEGQ